MRTLVTLFPFAEEQQEAIREIAAGWRVVFAKPKNLDEAALRDAEVLLGWHPAALDVVRAGGLGLRWLQAGSAGVDSLPLGELERLGVVVTTASGVHPGPMAETAFAMLLSFTRQLHRSVRAQTERRWQRFEPYGELRGRTLGIVGAGQIGVEVARIAQAFGMRTIGVRRSGQPAPHIDRMYAFEELDEALAASDAVVNILPGTEETRRLFDAERFSRFKPGALFLNIGRGSSVDADALVAALEDGRLGGAGLDVFELEPLPEEHPLWGMENVIVLPHIGGLSNHYGERLVELFRDNWQAYLAGGSPARNVVDFGKSY